MSATRSRPYSSIALVLMIFVGLTSVASAQSDSQLQRENERLQGQVNDLTRQIDAAKQQVSDLQEEVRQLREAMMKAGQTPPITDATPQVSVDETVPNASPRALFMALQSEYQETMADLEMGEPGDRQRIAYLRAVERFVKSSTRKYRSRIEWHVKFFERPQERNPEVLKIRAIDPQTGVQLGEPFEIRINRQHQRMLEAIEKRIKPDEAVILRGVLTPALRLNKDATESGPFNRPKLVGPFAEFNFKVEPQSFLTVQEFNEDKAKQRDAG
ncbi:MAG: hypothetical protein O7G85_11720 [Planctomycetota bacterium]|nr:hypothetical protein [Planctomycetota bacterium]